MVNLNLPVGVSDFERIRENGYYYIDKSGMITEILKTESTVVTLITRPRRFGKTPVIMQLFVLLLTMQEAVLPENWKI